MDSKLSDAIANFFNEGAKLLKAVRLEMVPESEETYESDAEEVQTRPIRRKKPKRERP